MNDILKFAYNFYKLALQISPYRNLDHDLEEAIDYSSNFIKLKDEKDLMDIPLDWLNINQFDEFPISKLSEYDDLSSWLETDFGELKSLSKNDRHEFLSKLRGIHAVKWLKEGIPAIIIMDFPGFKGIGDGRGRINFAIGMGYKTIPAAIISLKDQYADQINYKE